MPIGLLLLLGLAVVGGGYALTHHDDSDGSSPKKSKPRPQTLTEQLPGGGASNPKVAQIKAKICAVRAKAEQGDKDAGKVLADLKRLYGNVTK